MAELGDVPVASVGVSESSLNRMILRPSLTFCLAGVVGVLSFIVYRRTTMGEESQSTNWRFAAQKGFFSHDYDPESWDFRATTRPYLGLLEREYPTDAAFDPGREKTQWQRFEHYVRELNSNGLANQKYKVFYIVRHGQGVHNVKEKEVGREEWDRHWSKLSGDGTTLWEDAELTEYGEQQAREISTSGLADVSPPEAIYTSPLRRCLRTTQLAFAPLLDTTIPLIKENLRERLGVHTCDRRSSKSIIAFAFPSFAIEPGFTEDDELWNPDRRETIEEHMLRSTNLLNEIFDEQNESIFISLTVHSGAIMSLFGATGWKKIPVAAGAVYPLLLLAEKDNR
ncbi:phosphoglycerate mutase-like protein [Lentithecium fluviatile CBS 122367]|uniref:Phosphoglycerate mutase-like protein n=1 Tax=Lentithecium fluviatile CBS 122367 TaxID=1168545 RepID=A0A6G1IJF2_9PLEO|nr:phosphoglycerate mutase-like protein [Lentithecium fluviatile CBS 122367]